MVTAEEIAAIALFAGLDEVAARAACARGRRHHARGGRVRGARRETNGRCSRSSTGKIEAVKTPTGSSAWSAPRNPGDIFGEVPIVLGTVFPVGFRAAERSRVMRIEPRDYHASRPVRREVAKEVGRLAATGWAARAGCRASPPSRRRRARSSSAHRWDACVHGAAPLPRPQPDHLQLGHARRAGRRGAWGGPLPADDDLPAIRVIGGKTVVRPHAAPRRRAARARRPSRAAAEYDIVIVGAGPAGLAAAVYGASEGLRTIVVEREAPGGQAGTSSRIENYLGFPSGVSGDELASRALQQARRLGAEILVTRSIDADRRRATRQVHLDGGDVLRARTIILACGVVVAAAPIDGLDRLAGKGIFYGAARSEAPNTHGLDVHIIGAGNSAGQAALYFSTHARSVTILCRGDGLEKSMSRYLDRPARDAAEHRRRSAARGRGRARRRVARGDRHPRRRDRRDRRACESGGLFIFIGADARDRAGCRRRSRSTRAASCSPGPTMRAAGRWTLERDPFLLETSVPGVFACGDVRSGPVKRVAAAVGEGSMAIAFVHQYLAEAATAVR